LYCIRIEIGMVQCFGEYIVAKIGLVGRGRKGLVSSESDGGEGEGCNGTEWEGRGGLMIY
jgi:hypothetical protein